MYTDETKFTRYPETIITYYDEVKGHNIPQVFWEYLQQPGVVLEKDKQVTAKPLFDWL